MRLPRAVILLPVVSAQLVIQPQHRDNTNETSRAVSLNITDFLDNRGFGQTVGDANFDGYNSKLIVLMACSY